MNTETFLFDKIVFGPIKSRRLGLSLGINLLPLDSKLCNYNCIYCECGWTGIKGKSAQAFNSRKDVKNDLEEALIELKSKNITPDAITFAGNGEPTMHPHFSEIIDDTIELRNKHFPGTKIVVLTNATMLNRKPVLEALKKADLRILKLDAGTEELYQKINQPHSKKGLSYAVEQLQHFDGDLTVQSMFLKGMSDGVFIDNTTDENVNAWLELIKKIKPKQVMLYSINRATAGQGLEAISNEKLKEIELKVKELGIETMVS